MLRKQVVGNQAVEPSPIPGEIDVASEAIVLVTSESAGHPVDHAFDGHRGPGATRWIAGTEGDQTLTLAFDTPRAIGQVALEVEEPEVHRTQELQLAVSSDGGQTYRELFRQEYKLQSPEHDLRARRLGDLGRSRHSHPPDDPARQGG